ncbi:MAG: metal ABC transporter permease [Phycisphaerales bacterium]|nr:metal ABC transporter permease [Phycisphaerales bacterium]
MMFGLGLIDIPMDDAWLRALLLRDFNTRIVVMGVSMLGLASGVIGTFLLLRKRSLTADTLSHATLPGIAIAYMILVSAGGTGKSLLGLLAGALVFGVLGVASVMLIRQTTRLKDDAALGIVLSVFFGFGTTLLYIVQDMRSGSAAGLNQYIYGKAAAMLPGQTITVAVVALLVLVVTILMFKELGLLCFDTAYAQAIGWHAMWLDATLMALVVIVTVIALPSVGLLLAVALLIIPPAAARFWVDRLPHMVMLSALFGLTGGYIGAVVSAMLPRLPTGPVIVLVCATGFVISMLFGARRGIVRRALEQWSLSRRMTDQHLLRALYELDDGAAPDAEHRDTPVEDLFAMRTWSRRTLSRAMRRTASRGEIVLRGSRVRLTPVGAAEAHRLVRQHRLWETYLVHFADIAPSHVDRDADAIEHVLGADLVARLERLLADELNGVKMLESPHPIPILPGPASLEGDVS